MSITGNITGNIAGNIVGGIVGGGGSEAPAPWHPSQLPGVISVLDGKIADSFITGADLKASEGDPVSKWLDQSGNDNDWVQPNVVYQPTANLANNRLHNDAPTPTGGTREHLIGPDLSAFTELTFIAKLQNPNDDQGAIWGTTAWNNNNSLGHWKFGSTHYMCFGVDSRTSVTAASVGSAEMTYEQNVNAAGLGKTYVDGVEIASSTAATVAFRSGPYLGCGVRGGLPQYSGNQYFYRAVMTSEIFTPEERILVNTWLNE